MTSRREKVLVIKLGALGDVVMALPSVARIRAAHPGAEIVVLTSAPFAKLFGRCPAVDRVEARGRTGRMFETLHLGRWLERERFDRVYDLQNSSATRRLLGLIRLLPGPRPIWSGTAAGADVRWRDPGDGSLRAALRLCAQLDMTNLPTSATPEPVDRLTWMDEAIDAPDLRPTYALLVPGAAPGGEIKRWPEGAWRDLASRLAKQGLQPVVVGGPDDPELGVRVLDGAGLDLVGGTSLGQLAALARGAAVVVGNDSGPTHLAAATGTPTVLLLSGFSQPGLSQAYDAVHPLRVERLADLSVAAVESLVMDSARPASP